MKTAVKNLSNVFGFTRAAFVLNVMLMETRAAR